MRVSMKSQVKEIVQKYNQVVIDKESFNHIVKVCNQYKHYNIKAVHTQDFVKTFREKYDVISAIQQIVFDY